MQASGTVVVVARLTQGRPLDALTLTLTLTLALTLFLFLTLTRMRHADREQPAGC